MPRNFFVDTDTASDDAVALIMAMRAPQVRVLGISTVAGNVNVQQGTRNALYAVELCEAEVPVYMGAAQPLLRAYQNATWFHGQDGLGDHGYAPSRRSAEKTHAVEAIIETLFAHDDVVLVTLGPLTNIALALAREPGITRRVSRCVVMGGNPCCEGNVTPSAEYNMWVDPEAARMVLRSGLPVELIGWQLCRNEAALSEADIESILGLNTDLARFAIECNSHAREAYLMQTGEHGICLPDPVAMAIAIDPGLGTKWSDHFVEVETASELTRGMTVVDRLNVAGDERNREVWADALRGGRKTKVCWKIDIPRWKFALQTLLKP